MLALPAGPEVLSTRFRPRVLSPDIHVSVSFALELTGK